MGTGMWGHNTPARLIVAVIDPSRMLAFSSAPSEHSLAEKTEVNVGALSLDVIRLQSADAALLRAALPVQLIICALDWQHTDRWPAQIDAAGSADVPVLFTTTNLAAATRARASAGLSAGVDTCLQYLRTRALLLGAAMAYETTGATLDLGPIVAYLLGSGDMPEQRFVGSQVIIFGDSKQHILAVNPAFDFDGAASLRELPSVGIVSEQPPEPEACDLAGMLSAVANGAAPPMLRGEMQDDKEVISEFFNSIRQRA